MEKRAPSPATPPSGKSSRASTLYKAILFSLVLSYPLYAYVLRPFKSSDYTSFSVPSIYGTFPRPDDPLRLMPCTRTTVPPPLEDVHHEKTWRDLFDPHPQNWSWGNETTQAPGGGPHEYRGIYLCGYLDVPLTSFNQSDTRIVRLAVTKFQVSGLKRRDGRSPMGSGLKSERTLFIEPGGPGGSGTSYAWRAAETLTKRFTDSQYDVLGWDPRGVNMSQPAIACFPYDVDRDHWSLLTSKYREESSSPKQQLQLLDTMNDAIFRACYEKHGDLPSYMTTAAVARDMEALREAIGEDELTGYLVSYGTGIGQTYAGMFPDKVGRMILDGTEYVRDHRLLGGFGYTALDNVTDAWHDGFLGECVQAGPEDCALAKPLADGKQVTTQDLQQRLETLISSLIDEPVPAYTDFSGPSLITYSLLVGLLYGILYDPSKWPSFALILAELEGGNATLAANYLEHQWWAYDPTLPTPVGKKPDSGELSSVVICGDSYDAPLPEEGLDWWDSLWENMTETSWIAGNSRFHNVFPCRHFTKYWPQVGEVYRGDLNKTLRHPVLLIAETYDPATPLRNGRRLLKEMGENARLIAHHGYGHSSRDTSNCTENMARKFIMEGTVPDESETACYADQKPYAHGLQGDVFEGWKKYVWRTD